MDKIKVDMENIGKVELQPKFDGKQMIMVVQPYLIIHGCKKDCILYNPKKIMPKLKQKAQQKKDLKLHQKVK